MQRIYCQQPWLSLIHEGKKTVEGRCGPLKAYLKYLHKKVMVTNGDVKCICKVKAIRYHEWKAAAPHVSSKREAKETYLKIMFKDGGQVFSPYRIRQTGGMVAIELEHIPR